MRRLLLILCLSLPLAAQDWIGHTELTTSAPTGACQPGQISVDTVGQALYVCPNGGTWGSPLLSNSGGMVYPGAGVPNSTGSAWGSSYTVGTGANNLVQLNGSSQLPAVSAANLTNFPTLNQDTTGSAAKWTTARNLAGNSVDGSANVNFANKFVVQGTSDSGLTNAQFLGALGTGIVKNTTSTGVLSIAVAGDFPTLNQSTTGNAATATALASTPTLCSSGNAPTGILASGNATGCTAITGGGQSVAFLSADTAGSATNTLVTSGMTFAIAANTKYTLDCDLIFTVSTTSGVGLTLGVNGPGTPTEVSLMRYMNTTATAFRVDSSQGTSWAAKVGATATTVTALSMAHFYGLIENGSTAGTLDVQYANIGTTGTTVLKRGSWCKLQ